jgi:hypothetical protein
MESVRALGVQKRPKIAPLKLSLVYIVTEDRLLRNLEQMCSISAVARWWHFGVAFRPIYLAYASRKAPVWRGAVIVTWPQLKLPVLGSPNEGFEGRHCPWRVPFGTPEPLKLSLVYMATNMLGK